MGLCSCIQPVATVHIVVGVLDKLRLLTTWAKDMANVTGNEFLTTIEGAVNYTGGDRYFSIIPVLRETGAPLSLGRAWLFGRNAGAAVAYVVAGKSIGT